jgi:hypothetical protein
MAEEAPDEIIKSLRSLLTRCAHEKQFSAERLPASAHWVNRRFGRSGYRWMGDCVERIGTASGVGDVMTVVAGQGQPDDVVESIRNQPVGGPVSAGWREGTLTRAKELESRCASVLANQPNCDLLAKGVLAHIAAARQAAEAAGLNPPKRFRLFRHGSLIERAMSNLDAAEAQFLNLAPPDQLLGQMPSLLSHVQCHLAPTDPRRQEFEHIARRLGVRDPNNPPNTDQKLDEMRKLVEQERGKIVSITRGASSAALREQVRVRSFRNILITTTLAMTLLVVGVAIMGFLAPTMIPMCFAPEEPGQAVAVVVCPTAQSDPFSTSRQPNANTPPGTPIRDIDDAVRKTAAPYDLLVVEIVGLAAAAISAAAAIRGIRGSSERYGLPVTLAALKLPTGAITAVLGILLMRGQFVPGLSALDTSAQILAWALVFGYAQQLFTRLVDRQGQTVLDSVRGANKPQAQP